MSLGLPPMRAAVDSVASHMNQALPKSFFDRSGLVSPLDTARRLQCVQLTAACETAPPLVWADDRGDPVSDPIVTGRAPTGVKEKS